MEFFFFLYFFEDKIEFSLYQWPTFSFFIELIGVRHVQALLLFWGNLLCFSMRSMMSVAMVALTDAKSSNPDFPVCT